MMTLEEIKEKLKPYRPEEIAGEVGMSFHGVRQIMTGRVKNPSFDSVQKLVKFIEEREMGK